MRSSCASRIAFCVLYCRTAPPTSVRFSVNVSHQPPSWPSVPSFASTASAFAFARIYSFGDQFFSQLMNCWRRRILAALLRGARRLRVACATRVAGVIFVTVTTPGTCPGSIRPADLTGKRVPVLRSITSGPPAYTRGSKYCGSSPGGGDGLPLMRAGLLETGTPEPYLEPRQAKALNPSAPRP